VTLFWENLGELELTINSERNDFDVSYVSEVSMLLLVLI